MKYMLLFYANQAELMSLPKDEAMQMHGAFTAYTEALTAAGAHVSNLGLRPVSDATTVRLRDGKSNVQNGPFAETREQLAGFYLIEVPDLDAALGWAKRHPGAARGSIEVRPVWG